MSLHRFCTAAFLALLSIAFVSPAAADTVNLKYMGQQNQRTYSSIDSSNK